MTTTTWLLVFALLAGIFLLRRRLLARGIPQYDAGTLAGRRSAADAPVLLDVRSPAEHKARSIRGSMHIPLPELERRLSELEPVRGREIVCYCASGARSLSACRILMRGGFRAANLAGGIMAWRGDE